MRVLNENEEELKLLRKSMRKDINFSLEKDERGLAYTSIMLEPLAATRPAK